MNDAPSQSQDKFIIRLPDGMRDQLKAVAEKNKRSMNAEAVRALEFWLDWNKRLSPHEGKEEGPPSLDDVIIDAIRNAVVFYEGRADKRKG